MTRGLLFPGLGVLLLLPGLSVGSPNFLPGTSLRVAGYPGSQQGISLDEAVRRVQRETGGRILAADVVPGEGGVTYRIKVLLPSGRVKVVYVEARR